jgi:hypothetical protein
MKALSLLTLGLALLAGPAHAAIPYKATGQEIALPEAVKSLLDSGAPSQLVFDHGTVYVEIRPNESDARYGKAADVEVLAREIEAQRKVTKISGGRLVWEKSWNRLATEDFVAYDALDELRSYAKDSLEMDYAETEDDLYRTVITSYGVSYEPMSITGELVTYHSETSGYSGGAHDWIGQGFEAKEWISGEPASLLKYVDNQSLLEALQADKYLQKAAKLAGRLEEFRRETQLTELDRLLGDSMFGGELPVAWSLTPGQQFQKFAIWDYDVKKNEVLVRIGLEYNSEVNRGQFEQLGLRVKPKAGFAKVLKAMKQNGTGLFMKDVQKGKRP